MTEPKTAQQYNSQIVGTLEINKSRETVLTHDFLKIKVALRLLVEKWRQLADVREQFPFDGVNSDVIRQCAKELEEALK